MRPWPGYKCKTGCWIEDSESVLQVLLPSVCRQRTWVQRGWTSCSNWTVKCEGEIQIPHYWSSKATLFLLILILKGNSMNWIEILPDTTHVLLCSRIHCSDEWGVDQSQDSCPYLDLSPFPPHSNLGLSWIHWVQNQCQLPSLIPVFTLLTLHWQLPLNKAPLGSHPLLDGDSSLGPLLGTAVGPGVVQHPETTHQEPGLVNSAIGN